MRTIYGKDRDLHLEPDNDEDGDPKTRDFMELLDSLPEPDRTLALWFFGTVARASGYGKEHGEDTPSPN